MAIESVTSVARTGTVDETDVRVQAFRAAENRLWERHGITPMERHVTVGDPPTRVRFWEYGSGEPILFVHGGPSMGSEWTSLVAELAADWRCIVVDRPSYGLSEAIDYRTVDHRAYSVGILVGLLDELSLDSIPIVCSSVGGSIGFWLAEAHPDRVSSIVQLGLPAFVPDMTVPIWMRLLTVGGLNRIMLRLQPANSKQARTTMAQMGHQASIAADRIEPEFFELYAAYMALPESMANAVTEIQSVVSIGGIRPDYEFTAESLSDITQQTLLVWGENDPFGGIDVGERVARSMPAATIEAIESGGHLPWLDDPSHCGELVAAFLTEHAEA